MIPPDGRLAHAQKQKTQKTQTQERRTTENLPGGVPTRREPTRRRQRPSVSSPESCTPRTGHAGASAAQPRAIPRTACGLQPVPQHPQLWNHLVSRASPSPSPLGPTRRRAPPPARTLSCVACVPHPALAPRGTPPRARPHQHRPADRLAHRRPRASTFGRPRCERWVGSARAPAPRDTPPTPQPRPAPPRSSHAHPTTPPAVPVPELALELVPKMETA
jgi:hypothetical protein